MNVLIDTSNNLETTIKINQETYVYKYTNPREQNVLGALVQSLEKANITLKQISSVSVNLGPGSFTGLRVGVSVARTLAFALNVPINGLSATEEITIAYNQPPSITYSSKF